MFIKIFKDKLYFFLKGRQENICVYSLTLENFKVFCLFICLFVVVLLTVSELDLTDWNHTNSGESRQYKATQTAPYLVKTKASHL